jgi:hypothetical protein
VRGSLKLLMQRHNLYKSGANQLGTVVESVLRSNPCGDYYLWPVCRHMRESSEPPETVAQLLCLCGVKMFERMKTTKK